MGQWIRPNGLRMCVTARTGWRFVPTVAAHAPRPLARGKESGGIFMADVFSLDDAASRLAAQSDAVGQLAQDSGAFAAAVAAFEAKDADAFRWVLNRVEMLP